MSKRHRMTSARKAALRKAQLASARARGVHHTPTGAYMNILPKRISGPIPKYAVKQMKYANGTMGTISVKAYIGARAKKGGNDPRFGPKEHYIGRHRVKYYPHQGR